MTPCQKLLKQEGTARRIESMQQSSATPSLHLWFLGVAEDCCMLSILLAVPSCFNSFWHGVIPTSYFIFNDFYTCNNRCFTFGIGSGASTALVEGLAQAGNGAAEFVKEGERMQPKVSISHIMDI